jgi:hypothetical protein
MDISSHKGSEKIISNCTENHPEIGIISCIILNPMGILSIDSLCFCLSVLSEGSWQAGSYDFFAALQAALFSCKLLFLYLCALVDLYGFSFQELSMFFQLFRSERVGSRVCPNV